LLKGLGSAAPYTWIVEQGDYNAVDDETINYQADNIRDMSIDKLKALTLVKKNAADAKKQLLSYKTSLQKN
jgi:hypothetical protein